MKPNNVNTFLGLAALWLVLASSSLGAPSGPRDDDDITAILELLENLEDMKEFVCNATYFSTTHTEDQRENCFIYELENIEKTCTPKATNNEDLSVSAVVDDIRRHAKNVFGTNNYSISSCKGYKQKNVKDYIKDFTSLIQWKNSMQS